MTTNDEKKIAYLGPEIPALSATFIYNEILLLQKMGVQVISYSIHRPKVRAESADLQFMNENTCILYEQKKKRILFSMFRFMVLHIKRFSLSLKMLLHDIHIVGLFKLNSMKLIYQFLHACYLAEDLKRQEIEHLHVHFGHVPTQIGMYTSALADIPFTFTVHANDLFQRGLLLREKADRAKRIIAISDFNRNYLMSLGIERSKIDVIHCGVLIPQRRIKYENSRALKVGTIGRLVEKKGIDVLLDSCAILKNKDIPFHLEIVGDGPLLHDLQEKVSSLKLTDQVLFLGSIPHDRVIEWLQGIDIFALACKKDKSGDTDGIPVVLMEAMAMGIPSISTEISGIPELIENDKSGLLAHPDNAADFASKLEEILTNPLIAKQLGTEGAKKVEKHFNLKTTTSELKKVFMEKK